MNYVRAKKQLGQHFLKDENIAAKIANSLLQQQGYDCVLEIGPGMGVLTKYLFKNEKFKTIALDIDIESVEYLKKNYPEKSEQVLHADFLKYDLEKITTGKFAVIGNFPYNISSQILFRVLENKQKVPELVGMFQREVALRLSAKPRTKEYGILTVLLNAFYKVEYLFTVSEHVFAPPPKVKSAVIRLLRNSTENLNCNETLFFKVVKAAFNQRRKTLRNALSAYITDKVEKDHQYFKQRAEELTVDDFVELTNMLDY